MIHAHEVCLLYIIRDKITHPVCSQRSTYLAALTFVRQSLVHGLEVVDLFDGPAGVHQVAVLPVVRGPAILSRSKRGPNPKSTHRGARDNKEKLNQRRRMKEVRQREEVQLVLLCAPRIFGGKHQVTKCSATARKGVVL